MDLPCAVGYLCFWRPALHCLLHEQKGTGGLSDGTAEEENSTGLRPHLPVIWNRHVSVGIDAWPWYPCCVLDSVLLNVSQGLRLHAAQRYWNGRRSMWVGSAPTSLAQTDDMLGSSQHFHKIPQTPWTDPFFLPTAHFMALWGRALWSEKKSTGCPFESGHYRCFNLWHWQVRKIPWPEPERVVAGKVRSTIGEKLLGEEGKTLILKPGPLVLSAFLPFQD